MSAIGQKIRPMRDRVLVEQIKEETHSPGGIILPDSAKEWPTEGVVLAVGPGRTLECGKVLEPEVHEGDRIIFERFGGEEIFVEDARGHKKRKLLLLQSKAIMGVIRGD